MLRQKMDRLLAAAACLTVLFITASTLKKSAWQIVTAFVDCFCGEQELPDFKYDVEQSVTENLMGKRKLVFVDSIAHYLVTGGLDSTQVLMGKDTWLFYIPTLEDYQRTNSYSNEDRLFILLAINRFKEELSPLGAGLTLLIPPNKAEIYTRFMPDYIEQKGPLSRTAELVPWMAENSGINIIYPRTEMLAYGDKYQLYYQYDTHWNQLGSYIAAQQFLETLGLHRRYLEEEEITEPKLSFHINASDDLADIASARSWLYDKTEYRIKRSKEIDWEAYEKEQQQGFSCYRNPNAENDMTILLAGDSFRTSLVPHLAEEFSEVYVIDRNKVSRELLYEISPDEVILEYVERNLLSMKDYTIF